MDITQIVVRPGEIDRLHEHLKAGHEVACITYTSCILLNKPEYIDYIRADGNGYRLGWPGKRSDFCYADNLFLVAPGYTLKPKRTRRKK